jgi:ABC-type lipoprotein release transport system permease subunit
MKALLYETSPLDPVTFVAAPLTLMLVAILAATVPAVRAARIDPMSALRQ